MIQIHIDCDDIYLYEEEYKKKFNAKSIYSETLPNILKIAEKHSTKITFFIVARDLETNKDCVEFANRALLMGHEIANHSYSHGLNFSDLTTLEYDKEINHCDKLFNTHCNIKPIGFRSPGYAINNRLISALENLGYKYDASMISNFYINCIKIYKYFNRLENLKIVKNERFIKPETLKILPIDSIPFIQIPYPFTLCYFIPDILYKILTTTMFKRRKNIIYVLHAIDAHPFGKFEPLPLSKMGYSKRIEMIEHLFMLAKNNITTKGLIDKARL